MAKELVGFIKCEQATTNWFTELIWHLGAVNSYFYYKRAYNFQAYNIVLSITNFALKTHSSCNLFSI